jgi:hypothetical protein
MNITVLWNKETSRFYMFTDFSEKCDLLIFIVRKVRYYGGLSFGVYFLRSGENIGEEFKALEFFFACNILVHLK